MIVGLIGLTLVIIVVLWGHRILNRTVQKAIEHSASQALGVDVTIGALDLSWLNGVLTLSDLRIANPPGYQNKALLTLKQGSVVLEVSSLTRDTVKVTSVVLDTVDVIWEQKGLDNNLQDVIDHLPARDSTGVNGKALQIQILELDRAMVKAQLLPLPGEMNAITLKLTPIRLTNLGSQSPMDLRALARRVLSALVTRILEQGAKAFPADIMKPWQDTARSGMQFLKDAGELGETILNPPGIKEDTGVH